MIDICSSSQVLLAEIQFNMVKHQMSCSSVNLLCAGDMKTTRLALLSCTGVSPGSLKSILASGTVAVGTMLWPATVALQFEREMKLASMTCATDSCRKPGHSLP